MTERDQWNAIFDAAVAQKLAAGTAAAVSPITGRWITVLVDKLAGFWARHKSTLIPFLTNLAIAALDAVVAQRAAIDVVNPPGPG